VLIEDLTVTNAVLLCDM